MYRPLKIPTIRESKVTSLMAKRGENLRDLPQLLNVDYSLITSNYLITNDGALIKRKGKSSLFSVAGTNEDKMFEKWQDDYYVFAYSNQLSVYTKSTGTITNVSTFSASSVFEGDSYGDYFYLTDGIARPGHISFRLDWTIKTVNFTNGQIVTGGTSGATATILEGGGISGFLILGNIQGTFQAGETITDPLGGSATCAGAQYMHYRTLSNAPVCGTLSIIGSRLYLGNLKQSDSSAVAYSAVDDGTLGLPPFTNWTVNTNADQPGKVNFRRAGAVQKISSIGNIIIVLSDYGKWAFTIDTYDAAGTLKKKDTVVIDRTDFGGSRAALNCVKGFFYANEAGLWQLVSLGQPNIPFSDQEGLTSILLGNTYFDDVDLSDADMVYDAKINTLFITLAKSSNSNNLVIAYNTENKAFSRITGWNLNRFLNDNQIIYGAGSLETKFWQLFNNYDDDGSDIWTEYYQELKTGDLSTRQSMLGQYIQGFLSTDTELEISFDIYDTKGNFIENKKALEWTAQNGSNLSDGYGVASWGVAAWGGDLDTSNMVESFDGGRCRINNYQRLRIRITGHDQLPHAINWFSIDSRVKRPIRRRKLTQITT